MNTEREQEYRKLNEEAKSGKFSFIGAQPLMEDLLSEIDALRQLLLESEKECENLRAEHCRLVMKIPEIKEK